MGSVRISGAPKQIGIQEKIEFIYRGGKTRRYHTEDVLHQQNVAEHSYGVAMLCSIIQGGAPSANLLLAALTHDMAEHHVGDIPAPTKRASLPMKELLDKLEGDKLKEYSLSYEDKLTPMEQKILKVADIVDGMMFCVNERRRGNVEINRVYKNFYSYARAMGGIPKEAEFVINAANRLWEAV